MKQIDFITWEADEGMVFVRKADNYVMGNNIQLGENAITGEIDVIDNYLEMIID